MDEIRLINVGLDVPEIKGLRFTPTLSWHAFFYFQGPVVIGGKKYGGGACILYPAGMPHDYETLAGFVNSYIGFIAPAELFAKLSMRPGKVIFPDNCREINNVLFDIKGEMTARRRGWEEVTNGLILKLLATVSRGIEIERIPQGELSVKFTALREKYLSNIDGETKIDEIIAESGCSRTNFYRLYTRFFHVSPKDDLIRAKLQKARELILANPEEKLYKIAYVCGFNDITHFSRMFKRRYGYSPSDYVKAAKTER